MLFLNDSEEIIIKEFILNMNKHEKETMLLNWDDGSSVLGTFDSCIEDEDSETNEEYTSFIFYAIQANGEPPVFITQHGYFIINYKNFPKEILVNGKKIN